MAFGLFKKKNKSTSSAKGAASYFELTVKEVIKVTADAVNVVFENPSNEFKYQPGQFITLILTIDGEKIRRAYSLCTTPGVDENPAVTVKRVEGGLMSNYVNDKVKAGDVIEIMEPMGMFTTTFDKENERHLVLLGGGSGITPLFSILKAMLINEPKSNVSLIYANRNEDSIIFKNELDALVKKYSERLTIAHSLDQSQPSWEGASGLLNVEKLQAMLSTLPSADDEKTEYFTCGPEKLMDIVFDTLNALNVPDERRNRESFTASTTATDEGTATEGAVDRKVKVILEGQEYEVDVAAGKGILEASMEAGLDMPYSCQSGLCTACRAKCHSGKVSMEEADGLSQEEQDSGYVLTCVGKPLSDDVVVEMG